MDTRAANALTTALRALLYPLVRVLLRHGMAYGEFAEVARRVYVEVAERDFSLVGRKQTASRISVLTGLTRKDVTRIKESVDHVGEFAGSGFHRAARVVSGWVRECAIASGDPLDLPFDGAEPCFAMLVKRHSGDMPARAVLDELIRVGTVVRQGNGMLHLAEHAYVPAESDAEILGVLGRDTADLIATLEHNLSAPPGERFFQRKVFADNVPAESLPQLGHIVRVEAQALVDSLAAQMAKHDRDTNPDVAGSGRNRVAVGVYYFQEELPIATAAPNQDQPARRQPRQPKAKNGGEQQ